MAQRQEYKPGEPLAEQLRRLVMNTSLKDGKISMEPVEGSNTFTTKRAPYFNGLTVLPTTATSGIGKGGVLAAVGQDTRVLKEAIINAENFSIGVIGAIPVEVTGYTIVLTKQDDKKRFEITREAIELAMKHTWGIRGESTRYPTLVSSIGEALVDGNLEGPRVSVNLSGYCRAGEEIGKSCEPGDVVIGIASSGVHCCGIDLLRKRFEEKGFGLESKPFGPEGGTLAANLAEETESYLMPIKRLMNHIDYKEGRVSQKIKAMACIYAREMGGLVRVIDLLGENRRLDITINSNHELQPQPIFTFAHERLGISSEELIQAGNCGVGYAIVVGGALENRVTGFLRNEGLKVATIGRIEKGNGTLDIESPFDGKRHLYYVGGKTPVRSFFSSLFAHH